MFKPSSPPLIRSYLFNFTPQMPLKNQIKKPKKTEHKIYVLGYTFEFLT
jgi:hypothetical protein